jgi:hypothetical protein
MFTVQYKGREELQARFDAMPDKLHAAIKARLSGLGLELKDYIKHSKLEGQVLHVVTGKLKTSIQNDLVDSSDKIVARVYSADSASPYNRVHEYGLMIPERVAKGKAMRFMVNGEAIFARRCKAFKMPERSYMRSSLEEFKPKIIKGLEQAAKQAVKA